MQGFVQSKHSSEDYFESWAPRRVVNNVNLIDTQQPNLFDESLVQAPFSRQAVPLFRSREYNISVVQFLVCILGIESVLIVSFFRKEFETV